MQKKKKMQKNNNQFLAVHVMIVAPKTYYPKVSLSAKWRTANRTLIPSPLAVMQCRQGSRTSSLTVQHTLQCTPLIYFFGGWKCHNPLILRVTGFAADAKDQTRRCKSNVAPLSWVPAAFT